MPVALHFLALDSGTLGTLCRDRYSSQAAQKQHAQKRQDGSFHGIGSVHTFVTCQRGEALLYGRALWPDSYHMEVTLWTGTGRQNLDVQGFIVGKKSKKSRHLNSILSCDFNVSKFRGGTENEIPVEIEFFSP